MFDMALISENGPFENLQVAVLALATLLFLKKSVDLFRASDEGLSSYALTSAMLPLLGAARELSFGRVLGMEHDLVAALKLSIGMIAVSMVVYALTLFLRSTDRHLESIRKFVVNRSSLSIYLGLLVIGAASAFEKGYLGLPRSVAAEEMLELVAFCFILRAAMILKTGERASGPASRPAPALAGMAEVYDSRWHEPALRTGRR